MEENPFDWDYVRDLEAKFKLKMPKIQPSESMLSIVRKAHKRVSDLMDDAEKNNDLSGWKTLAVPYAETSVLVDHIMECLLDQLRAQK